MSKILNILVNGVGLVVVAILYLKDDLYRGFRKKLKIAQRLKEKIEPIEAAERLYAFNPEVYASPELRGLINNRNDISKGLEGTPVEGRLLGVDKTPKSAQIKLERSPSLHRAEIVFGRDFSIQFGPKITKIRPLYKSLKSLTKKLIDEGKEIDYQPRETIKIQIILLFDNKTDFQSRLEKSKKLKVKIDPEVKRIFAGFSGLGQEVKTQYLIRENTFKNRNYYDKEEIEKYDIENDFWRLTPGSVENVNILIAALPRKVKADQKMVRYRNNFVFEVGHNIDSRALIRQLKLVAYKKSTLHRLKTLIEAHFEDFEVDIHPQFLRHLNQRLVRFNAMNEVLHLLRSILYVETSLNVEIKDEYVQPILSIFERIETSKTDKEGVFEDSGIFFESYRLNREGYYRSVYIFENYRMASAAIFIFPLCLPFLRIFRKVN